MSEHSCYIGEWLDYERTEMVTFEELQEKVKSNNETFRYGIETLGFPIGKIYLLSEYFDKRKNTNFNHFNFCPYCGEKIEWSKLRAGVKARWLDE